MARLYICIDLKSFYASVECVDRHLDPLTTNLVVADEERSEKTICLAVTPALKSFGISSRPRLFQVIAEVKKINAERRKKINYKKFKAKAYLVDEINSDPYTELDFLIAKPRMSYYIEISSKIYSIYLKYFSSDDIHVYSIDEVFIDITDYLNIYNKTSFELVRMVIRDIFSQTGITATAGIGTNLYLAKVAMDIVAKKLESDSDNARIAYLDELLYRKLLWHYEPITAFWRVGNGIAKRLAKHGIYTMGDIALCANGIDEYYNEDLLYKEFGINAELLIDHAWGYESTSIKDIKEYKPKASSLSVGQVLPEAYSYQKGRLIVKEMVESLSLDLVKRGLVTNHIGLYISYDNKLKSSDIQEANYIENLIPNNVHKTINIGKYTSSTIELTRAILRIYDEYVNVAFGIRRVNISVSIIKREELKNVSFVKQYSIFDDIAEIERANEKNEEYLEKEQRLQQAIIMVKNRYGNNSLLKGMNLEEGSTAKERNKQIGGHRA